MARITLEGYRCERCGHQWVKRSMTEGDPIICPKCKSAYWNKPRRTDTIASDRIAKDRVKGDRIRK